LEILSQGCRASVGVNSCNTPRYPYAHGVPDWFAEMLGEPSEAPSGEPVTDLMPPTRLAGELVASQHPPASGRGRADRGKGAETGTTDEKGGMIMTTYDQPPKTGFPWLWIGTACFTLASVVVVIIIISIMRMDRATSTPPSTQLSKSAVLPSLSSKVTQTNYDKLKLGMSQSEVEKILGPGREIADNMIGPCLVWENGKTKITIVFAFYSEESKTLFAKKIEP
jgi:hypothetical protein